MAVSSVLRLSIEEAGSRCRIVAKSGQIEREIEVDILPNSLRQDLLSLQEAILRSPGSRRGEAARSTTSNHSQGNLAAETAHDKMVQEIGSQLFDFIFQRKVLELYRDTLATRQDDEPLRIKFCVQHPKLSYLPWETLYDKASWSHLTTSPVTPFSRSIRDVEDEMRFSAGRPIRILGMAARIKTINGITVDAIDVDGEQIAMKEALGELEDGRSQAVLGALSEGARSATDGRTGRRSSPMGYRSFHWPWWFRRRSCHGLHRRTGGGRLEGSPALCR